MKRVFIGITLLIGFAHLWTILVADADDFSELGTIEQGVDNTERRARSYETTYLYADILCRMAGTEYARNQAKINKGKSVTAASLLALGVQTASSPSG